MWKSTYCIFLSMIIAIIGLGVDLLMWQENVNNETFDVQATWGYQDVHVQVIVGDLAEYSNSINYENAYNSRCANSDVPAPNYCNDLNNLNNAGQTYMTVGCFGFFLLSIAFIFSILISVGKSCCRCNCRLRLVVAVLVLLAAICFLISFAIFINSFSNNVDNLLNDFIPAKFGVTWEQVNIGSSIALVISAMCLSFLSLSMILFIDRKEDNNNIANNNNYAQYPAEQFAPANPPSSTIVYFDPNGSVNDPNGTIPNAYGEPDHIYSPMLQSNSTNSYKTQGE